MSVCLMSTLICSLPAVSAPQNQDSVNTDTVCRLYEVGRQRLAEEEEEDEEDQVGSLIPDLFKSLGPK